MKNIACALPLVFTAASLATQQPVPPAEPQTPTFRSRTQIVEVDARVFDDKGQFVATLTKDDFEVLEDGVPQVVQASYLVVGPASQSTAGAENAAAPALDAPSAPQTWLFVFDLNHLAPGAGFERSQKAVEDFVAKRFREGDLAGVIAGDKMVNNRLTSVRSEILQALKQVKPGNNLRARANELTRQWPRFLDEEEAIRVARNEREVVNRVIERACSDDPTFCEIDPRAPETHVMAKGLEFQQAIHGDTLSTLSSLNALATGFAQIPGPKTVVFISSGFVSMNIETTVRSVVGQTARAGGRIYAIDVRGLDRAGSSGTIDRAFTEDFGATLSAVPTFDMLQDGPNSLAIDTGGVMIRNENNLGRALDRIADDAGRYYVLAYEPTNTTFDGKYRPLEVRVKRPGLAVRARRGYLALDPAKMLRPQAITTSLSSPAPLPLLRRTGFLIPATLPDLERAHGTSAPASGTVVTPTEAVPSAAAVRLRPDSEGRVKALSSRESTPAGELVTRGWDAYQRGDVEAALGAFAQATSQGDVRPWVLYAMGMSHAALGQAAEAIAAWERVRHAAPDYEPVYMDLADTYAQTGDWTRALATLRDAEKRWPTSADVQSAIGVIHVRRGALDEGIAALTKAADAKPDDPLAQLNLGRAYELRFHRNRRFVASQRRWVAPEEDRTRAAQAYERCIKLGGPYALKAAEALSMLEWGKTGQEESRPQ